MTNDELVTWMRANGVTHYEDDHITLTLGPAPVVPTKGEDAKRIMSDEEATDVAKARFRELATKASGKMG